ncbi:MAG: hypothetical protein M0Q53_04010 [Prolixibacteraceae bacterium]|jgi:ATP-dependent DNA helicase RecG|nr:hypothetical protein [Prolixibacteraceae bacterium]
MAKEVTREEPRFYMGKAIEVMKKSIPEKNKSNPSPNVGAVLVFPDGTFDTASRGEFREGDHAEYTLLDKKYRAKDLSDCWLFATLEPCAPGSRTEPKLSCAERIANARIKKVWFGVQELNHKASGGKLYLEQMGATVLPFESDLCHEIRDYNKTFDDWVEEERKRSEAEVPLIKGFLDVEVKNADIKSLSDDALQLYIDKTENKFNVLSKELFLDLYNKGLFNKLGKTETLVPTGNCILLFGKNPRDKFPQAAVKAKVDYGNGQIDVESFNDAIVMIPDQVENWVKKVIPESFDRSSFTREKIPHFPPSVIREAIINAIVHRDYSIKGSKIELEITSDKIEIKSPGEPYSPNSLSSLQDFSAVSYARNAEIAYIFNIMRLMEETRVGMDTFKSLREKYNLPLPIISYKNPYLIVTFPRTADAVRALDEKLNQLNDEELQGYEFVKAQGDVSKTEYAHHFGFEEKKAYRHLSKMKKLDLLTDNGETTKSNNYRYVFKGN